MRPKYFIYPYGPSNSALALAEVLGGRVIKRVNSKYRYKPQDTLINWGSTNVPIHAPMVNSPFAVQVASSKLTTFDRLQRGGVSTVEVTRDQRVAQEWNNGHRVVGRDLDRGSGGRGITIYERGNGVGQHLFYTKYIRKQREFRFHVYKGRIVRVLEKLRKKEYEHLNKYVRSHLNGWVFASGHLKDKPAPPELQDLALKSVAVLGLDFGGVDIGWHERTGGVVYEVNTAPGLEGETIKMYANAIVGA